jgi:hypothetical protein
MLQVLFYFLKSNQALFKNHIKQKAQVLLFQSDAVVAIFATTHCCSNSQELNIFFICLEITDLSLLNNSDI